MFRRRSPHCGASGGPPACSATAPRIGPSAKRTTGAHGARHQRACDRRCRASQRQFNAEHFVRANVHHDGRRNGAQRTRHNDLTRQCARDPGRARTCSAAHRRRGVCPSDCAGQNARPYSATCNRAICIGIATQAQRRCNIGVGRAGSRPTLASTDRQKRQRPADHAGCVRSLYVSLYVSLPQCGHVGIGLPADTCVDRWHFSRRKSAVFWAFSLACAVILARLSADVHAAQRGILTLTSAAASCSVLPSCHALAPTTGLGCGRSARR